MLMRTCRYVSCVIKQCKKFVPTKFVISCCQMSVGKLIPEPKLVTMKFESTLFRALFTPETKLLSEIFMKYNYELRIAGGAVRDLLMDKQPIDVDFATTATPDQMRKMFTEEGVRMFNRKGESHGTVTVRVNDQQNFEITTLRVDLRTDGRHAEVEFTTNWELDASRRDLTINAMFLGLDGVLHDYFYGVEDLERRLVRFVGEPESRIKEDYLRILRYFRFYGRIAVKPDEHNAKTLQAIQENIGGLEMISGERLWVELKKILVGNHVKHIIVQMLELGIAAFLGLPQSPNITEFKEVCTRAVPLEPQAMTLLIALLKNEEDVMTIHSRCKMSKYEKELALFLINHRKECSEDRIKIFKRLILESKFKLSDVQDWVYEVCKYNGDTCLLEKMRNWQVPKFPVNGHMLMQRGLKSGPNLNKIITELKKLWVDSNCTLTQEELLKELDVILER